MKAFFLCASLCILGVAIACFPAWLITRPDRIARELEAERRATLTYVAEVYYFPPAYRSDAVHYFAKDPVVIVDGIATFTDALTGEIVRLSGSYNIHQKN